MPFARCGVVHGVARGLDIQPLRRDNADGLERVAQYIIRNPFSEQKMVYNQENGTVIYRSRMHAKTKRKLPFASLTAALRAACLPPVGLKYSQPRIL